MSTTIPILVGARTLVYLNGNPLSLCKSIKIAINAHDVAKGIVTFYEPKNGRIRMVTLPNGKMKPFTHTMKVFINKIEHENGKTAIYCTAANIKGISKEDTDFLLDLIKRATHVQQPN